MEKQYIYSLFIGFILLFQLQLISDLNYLLVKQVDQWCFRSLFITKNAISRYPRLVYFIFCILHL